MVVGAKARLFAERGRTDIIAALQDHDIGSHTTNHSIHPTIAEYLANTDWEEGVLEAMEKEGNGLTMLTDVFRLPPTSWGQAGGSWGPQINAAMYRLINNPAVVYPPTQTGAVADLHWYAGSLVFPGPALAFFDDALTDDDLFQQALQRLIDMIDSRLMLGTRWTGIFVCHPTRLRAIEFWDTLNFAKGENTASEHYQMPTLRSEEAYQTALQNFDRLVEHLKQDLRLEIRTIADLSRTYTPPPETVYLYQLDETMLEMQSEEGIPTRFRNFSPAEFLDLILQTYTQTQFETESLRRRMVFGPIDEPPEFDPPGLPAFWDDFLVACQQVLNHINRFGRLPASIYIRDVRWSIGSFFWGAVEAWPAFRSGRPPRDVNWRPSSIYPAIGQQIAAAVQEGYDSWPIHVPELDLNKLLMYTCFQCWTLRPAY
jgi:hypothetical protein